MWFLLDQECNIKSRGQTWASSLALRSSSSLRFRMFSFSCWASPNDCRNWSKMPKNSSGCILLASSPKCVTAFTNCGTEDEKSRSDTGHDTVEASLTVWQETCEGSTPEPEHGTSSRVFNDHVNTDMTGYWSQPRPEPGARASQHVGVALFPQWVKQNNIQMWGPAENIYLQRPAC